MATIPTGKVDSGTAFILGRNWTSEEEYREHAVAVFPIIYGISLIIGLMPSIILGVGLLWALVRQWAFAILRIFPKVTPKLNAQQSKQVLKLSEARAAAKQSRYRVTFILFQVGWLLTALCLFPVLFYMQGMDAGPLVGSPLLWLGFNGLTEPIFLLGIFPTDTRLIRCLSAGQGIFNFFFTWRMPFLLYQFTTTSDFLSIAAAPSWLLVTIAEVFSNLMCVVIQSQAIACHCCCPKLALSPRQSLRRTWLSNRLYFALVGPFWIEVGAHSLYLYSIGDPHAQLRGVDGHVGVALYGFAGLIFAVLATPRNRGRAHRELLRLASTKGSAEQEAAAVAALVGDVDPTDALATAGRRFRALPFSALHPSDLATNREASGATSSEDAPMTSLAERSVACKLGECDAFFSHSWSDEQHCPGSKYAVLQQWASSFEKAHQKPALLWLDKACIDQDNINASLACLPIFLSGCTSLLVAAGPTYSTRLWCVVEIFTFLKMGGTKDELVLLPVGGVDVRAQLSQFDASKAQCFLRRDREKLLGVIESGFGDLYAFNQCVKHIFPSEVVPAESLVAVAP